MALELSYKGLSDQIGVISPNFVRNPFFIADPVSTTKPSGWLTEASSIALDPVYDVALNALDGKSLVLSGSGYVKCDDFIKISGGTEMLGLYQSPLDFTISVFLKGSESVTAPTSGLKIEFFDDTDTVISSKTKYFNYTTSFALQTAVLTLDDTDFDSDYKLKIKLTNMSATKTIYVKLLSFNPGDVAPSFFLPSSLTEETLNSIKNKVLTITTGATTILYDGSTARSVNVVSAITSSSGLTSNTSANGPVTLTNTGVTSLTGTANQIVVSTSTGAVTLTTPQSIGTTSNVTFGSVVSTSNVSSTNGTFKARTGNVTGTAWTTHGWGKIGLASGSGAPSAGEAGSPSAGDFFLRY